MELGSVERAPGVPVSLWSEPMQLRTLQTRYGHNGQGFVCAGRQDDQQHSTAVLDTVERSTSTRAWQVLSQYTAAYPDLKGLAYIVLSTPSCGARREPLALR